MVVVSRDKGIDGDNTVAAGPIVDDDGLAPALTELIGKQARADVSAAPGSQRYDKSHRSCRPICRCCESRAYGGDERRSHRNQKLPSHGLPLGRQTAKPLDASVA